MSFASAKLTFINCNSCSILSNVRSDKSFPKSVNGCDYRHSALAKQRRSPHNDVITKRYPTVYDRSVYGLVPATERHLSELGRAWVISGPLTILSGDRPLSAAKRKLETLEILDSDFRNRPLAVNLASRAPNLEAAKSRRRRSSRVEYLAGRFVAT